MHEKRGCQPGLVRLCFALHKHSMPQACTALVSMLEGMSKAGSGTI